MNLKFVYTAPPLDDDLVTRGHQIDEAPLAFADLESGKKARRVIVF